MGDINIYTNDMDHQDAQIFLDTFNLKQNVNNLTYNLGHALDLIIKPATYEGSLISGPYLSDHRFITLETTHAKPKQEKRIVWKFNDETITEFKNEFNNLPILKCNTLDKAANKLNKEMLRTIKKIAPATTKTITSRHKKPWYNEDLKTKTDHEKQRIEMNQIQRRLTLESIQKGMK